MRELRARDSCNVRPLSRLPRPGPRTREGGLVSDFVDELEQATAFACDLETIEVRISS
jgi:hypothetical protein